MQTELDLFAIRPEDKIPERGKILISEPFLPDLFFSRTIIYLTSHSTEGAIGFVLNRQLNITLSDVMNGFERLDSALFMGGPVAPDTLHFIHSLGNAIPNSLEIKNNIFWGGDIDAIRHAIKTGKAGAGQVRFFLGYSGWSAGQLEKELKENSWVIASARQDMVMNSYGDDAWKRILKSMNSRYRIWADFPESPDMN